jgi:hypothetical protein
MDIEQYIRKSFQRYARTMEVPAELDTSVALGLKQRGNSGGRR